jgi:hypothetical protein
MRRRHRRERGQRAVILPCEKNGGGVGVALDGADGSPSEHSAAEYAATSAREKSQLMQHDATRYARRRRADYRRERSL